MQLPRRLHLIILIIAVLVAIAVILAWSNDLWESEPEDVVERGTLLEYTWKAQGFPDTLSEIRNLKVDEGIIDLRITYAVDLPSGNLSDIGLEFNPEISFALRDPYGNVGWNETFNRSVENTIIWQNPLPGTWTLRIEAIAYGGEVVLIEVQDSIRLTVEAM